MTTTEREFNPSRLDLARRRRGVTKTALAEAVGITSRTLRQYDRGAHVPAQETLGKIAAVLEFPVEFFSGHDLEDPPVAGSSFRSLSTLTASQRDRALAGGTLAIALADWIDATFELPEPSVPMYADIDPEGAAAGVREEWGLGERPIGNVIHLLESRGVRVFSLAEDSRDIDAFSFWRDDVPYIFLNTQKSPEHRRMDLAHELGHLVLHSKDKVSGTKVEREAQLFGASFLMPRGSLLSQIPPGATLGLIIQAKKIWKVSVANLAYRMHTVGLLNDYQYRDTFIEISRRGYRTSEPDSIEPETSQMLAKVFDLIRDEGESIVTVARRLHITVDELSRLIFGLTLAPVPVPTRWALSKPA